MLNDETFSTRNKLLSKLFAKTYFKFYQGIQMTIFELIHEKPY